MRSPPPPITDVSADHNIWRVWCKCTDVIFCLISLTYTQPVVAGSLLSQFRHEYINFFSARRSVGYSIFELQHIASHRIAQHRVSQPQPLHQWYTHTICHTYHSLQKANIGSESAVHGAYIQANVNEATTDFKTLFCSDDVENEKKNTHTKSHFK